MTYPSPYLEEPVIPEGMTIHEYRINRPKVKVSAVRRVIGLVVVR
ncbi:MAG: hypothetical protein ACJ77Z_18740 [Thermoleophilaceae bacterium]|jgi:hypothetical protein